MWKPYTIADDAHSQHRGLASTRVLEPPLPVKPLLTDAAERSSTRTTERTRTPWHTPSEKPRTQWARPKARSSRRARMA